MKTYLYQLFHLADQEKIDEKTMLARIAVSVCIVLFCLTANVVSAYAYFSYTITSGNNTITAGHFSTTTTAPVDAASLMGEQEGYLLYNDTEETKGYIFELAKSQNATASVGYCRIEIVTDINDLEDEDETNDVQKFFTLPIGRYVDSQSGEERYVDSRTIEIMVPAGQSAYVTFVAEWGSCSQEPIVENGVVEPEFGELSPEMMVSEDETVSEDEAASKDETISEDETASEDETVSENETLPDDETQESEESLEDEDSSDGEASQENGENSEPEEEATATQEVIEPEETTEVEETVSEDETQGPELEEETPVAEEEAEPDTEITVANEEEPGDTSEAEAQSEQPEVPEDSEGEQT